MTGKVVDRIKFTRDYILLSNYAGVSMNGRKLAIVSLQNQLIKIYEIDHKGRFNAKQIVGYSLYGDDYEEVSGKPLLGFRQRLMSYLYRNALEKENPQLSVRLLYNNWEIVENLCISRVQFLDDAHLLIKLTCPESLSVRSRAMSDSVLQNTAFFVELYEAVRDYNDYLRVVSATDPTSDHGISWQSTPSTDIYERQVWERNVQLLAASRPAQGDLYAAKRLLLSLPYSPQTYSESPYLDPSIFRFDERSVSSSERQRSAADFPVRFFSRRSDRVAFRLNSGSCPDTAPPSSNPYRVK
ncbi:hypothetical protein PSACC_01089 [Paramicrosporidium saccamoebae]|uniref:Uncharacterized protein n=1 Tax=Paramicrosporidium saccamoebae TaxID=1246581 RepID=A0A2H9TN02_9FUNG|nr:hypothetical protein PSACC_01089 [Paramicrosporidium saccamoebae]